MYISEYNSFKIIMLLLRILFTLFFYVVWLGYLFIKIETDSSNAYRYINIKYINILITHKGQNLIILFFEP